MLEASRLYFRKAADALELPNCVREILLAPFRIARELRLDSRTAALVLAIRRVGEAALARQALTHPIRL